MEPRRKRILWVDDEIDRLEPLIMFLGGKGYEVHTAADGASAINQCVAEHFDLVLLDEMMPGLDGLETLEKLQSLFPTLPVIMITKSEEERLMEAAIGRHLANYLTKPVTPTQVLAAVKKVLESPKLTADAATQDYTRQISELRERMDLRVATWQDWIAIVRTLVQWDLVFDQHPDPSLRAMHRDLRREADAAFGRFVEINYPLWVAGAADRPMLSTDIVKNVVLPEISTEHPTFFVVVDCMRYDQWAAVRAKLGDLFTIDESGYFCVLPSATPYSRNALFSGLFPGELATKFPEIWSAGDDDTGSRNRQEHYLLDQLLKRLHAPISESKYVKILDPAEGERVARSFSKYFTSPLTSIVVNFLDNLAHGRSESELLQEITPDEAAFRSLMRAWFDHSALWDMFQQMAKAHATVIVTTDHGAVVGRRGSKAFGRRDTSSNLRYKYGDSLGCDQKQAVFVKDPKTWKLPSYTPATTYILAKEDYYFVYPSKFHEYARAYRDSFQHGGVSLEECVVPLAVLRAR